MKGKLRLFTALLLVAVLLGTMGAAAAGTDGTEAMRAAIAEQGLPEAVADAVMAGGEVPAPYADTVAYVSTEAELQAALANDDVSIIVLLADISTGEVQVIHSLTFLAIGAATIEAEEFLIGDGDVTGDLDISFSNVTVDVKYFEVDQPNGGLSVSINNGIFYGNGFGGDITDNLVFSGCQFWSVLGYSNSSFDFNGDGRILIMDCIFDGFDRIQFDNPECQITDSIIRNGQSGLYLDGGTHTITNLEIYGIESEAIRVDEGDVTIANSTFTNCGDYESVYTEAVLVFTGCSLYMSDVEICNNLTAGLYLRECSATLIDCLIENNESSLVYELGGGIFADYGELSLTRTNISNNSATEGGGIYSTEAQLSMTDVNIFGNKASRGGGIYILIEDEAELETNNVLISENTAEQGGGLYIELGVAYILEGVTVQNNSADYEGGGILVEGDGTLTLADVEISGNTAGLTGGGIFTSIYRSPASPLVIDGARITGNTALYGGGGLSVNADVTVNSGAITGNSAYLGGGIYTQNQARVTLNGGTVSGNTSYWGGDIW